METVEKGRIHSTSRWSSTARCISAGSSVHLKGIVAQTNGEEVMLSIHLVRPGLIYLRKPDMHGASDRRQARRV